MPVVSESESPTAVRAKAAWLTACEAVSLQSRLEQRFKAQPGKVKHDKTAVLLLHWEESACDMDVSNEVCPSIEPAFKKNESYSYPTFLYHYIRRLI